MRYSDTRCFFINYYRNYDTEISKISQGGRFMEKLLNDSRLRNRYKIENDGQILFVQKWREMFNHKTINTYQVKLRNTHYILEETLKVIESIKRDVISSSNLKDLLLESKN